MSITRIVLLATLLCLTACASSPRYVAAGSAEDYGHYTHKLSENRYRINFNGGRSTSVQDTRDFALLRAAEVTLANGYNWFQIVDRETATVESREPHVGFGYERAWYVRRDCGLVGCRQSVQPATYATWRIESANPAERHSHSIEIVMGNGPLPEDGRYYDAQAVVDSIYESI